MRFSTLFAATLFLAPSVRADLTIHYKTSYTFAQSLPAPMADAMKQQMTTSMPTETSVQIHGDQIVQRFGALTCILDYAKQRITLLHPPSKRFTTVTTTEFAEQVKNLVPAEARQALQSVKLDVQAAKSGKTATIHDVPAEETVLTMSMEAPGPNGPAIQMRMEMHNWMATAEALVRFPELKQWDAKKWMSVAGLNPVEMMTSAFAQGPSADKLRSVVQNLMNETTGLTLKTETRIFMPFLVQMMKAQGSDLGDAPLVSTAMEMDRFGTEVLPASVFQVPEGYQAAPVADLMKEFNPMQAGAPR